MGFLAMLLSVLFPPRGRHMRLPEMDTEPAESYDDGCDDYGVPESMKTRFDLSGRRRARPYVA